MGEVGWMVVFVMTFISCNALLDLSGVHQVTGTWMGSTTVPCTYVPSKGFTLQTLSWRVQRDSSTSTIFRRDGSGDHVLLAKFRGRVSVPKHGPGDASLLIQDLEMPDSGHYTCQIVWRATDNSLITREVTTIVKVVKVAATKPIIRAGEPGLTLPAGASTSLTCEAGGSPPISYRWFRSGPAGRAELLSSGAELAWPSLRPSDSGSYFCEAHNRAGAGAAQRSDAVRLTVTDLPTTTTALPRNVGTMGGHHSTTGQEETSDGEHTVTERQQQRLAPPLLENVPDDGKGQANVVCVPLGPELLKLQSFRGRSPGARDLAQASRPQGVYGAAIISAKAARNLWGKDQGGEHECQMLPQACWQDTHRIIGPVPTTRVSRMDSAPAGPSTDTGSPLLLVLLAALGGAALGALLAAGLGWWRRRRTKEEPLYEVAFRSTAEVALLQPEVEVPVKCLQEETCSSTDKTTVKDRKSPEYENLVTAMECQYETEGI